MKLIVGLVAGMFMLALPGGRAIAAPVDCEAARCAIQSQIDAECDCATAKNHGRYTSCVARVVNRAAREGTIPRQCRGKINSCAIRSTCGKKAGTVACDFPGDGVAGRCRPLSSAETCTNRGGTVVASCCDTCGAPEPTSTPGAPGETPTAVATPVETATAGPGETATPVETPVETATAAPGETATPSPVETPAETATAGPGETATPAETATAGPAETATAGPGETPTPIETPVETATAGPGETATPVETASAEPTPVETASAEPTPVETASEGPVETATAGPVETATPEPLPTSTPAAAACGNNTVDTGEGCDPPGQPSCTTSGNGLEFCSLGCTCECPSRISFTGDATDPTSILDTGWTGIAHRAPIISNGTVTVGVECAAATRPCGTCATLGPVPNTGENELQNQRCTNDTSIQCTDNTPCTGGTCQFFFGSTLPLAAGGVTTCVVNQFNGPVTGTANIETGEAVTTAFLTSRVFNGIAIDNPCPRCVGDTTINDGVQGGTCDGGPRAGMNCDSNGDVPGRPDFGQTSLDCPPNPGGVIATLPINLTSATDPVTKTLTAASPGCTGVGANTNKCLCDTCNNANADPCSSNADCPTSGGAAGICGGRRCLSGANNGAPCTTNTQCPGGSCARPGEPTKPSGCLDDTTVPNRDLECADPDGDGEGECTVGPADPHCSVASGHAQRGCGTDADCGGSPGTCISPNRQCFLTGGGTFQTTGTDDGTDTLTAIGIEDPPVNDVSHPTLAAVFCVGPTSAGAVNNVAGLPGPGRVTIKGTALGLPPAQP